MRIEAATLAGGEVNQDYYAYGKTYAIVLDGASSFLPEKTSIDAATYVKALGDALAIRLESCHLNEMPDVVATAICEVAVKYDLVEESSPNSTIAIAKWNKEELCAYVLGDSPILIMENSGNLKEISDNRMAQFGDDIRNKYKLRLSCGLGFDEVHKESLKKLQQIQKKYKNISNGYWVAGAKEDSAYHAITKNFLLSDVRSIIICSDGGYQSLAGYSCGVDYLIPESVIKEMHIFERRDEFGIKFPRSKKHDDKTIVVIKKES